jgi:hypothetical protein
MNPRFSLACLILAGHAALLAAEEPKPLRWKFHQGQALQVTMKHREVKTVSVGDQQFETVSSFDYEWKWKVLGVDADGTASIEQKLASLRMTCSGKDFAFQYDSAQNNRSDDPYKKELIEFLDQLRFADFRLRLKPDGAVAEVRGFDKLIGETTFEQKVVDFHGHTLHDGSFGWLLQLGLGVLPPAPGAARWKFAPPA